MTEIIQSEMVSNLSQFTIDIFSYKPGGYVLILYYIEIVFLFLALILSILIIILLFKFKLFHLNLRVLFCNQFIANIIFVFVRYGIIAHTLRIDPLFSLTIIQWLHSLHNGIVEFFSINLISIVIERLQSTVKAANYENYFTFSQLVILLCFPWLISFGITLIFQYNLLEVTTILEGVVILDAFFLLAFIVLQLFNKKRQRSFDIHTTLSYRFQIQENVSTMKFLSYLCFVYSIYLVLSMAFLYVIFSVFHRNQQFMHVIVGCCVFDILTAFHCFIIPLFFMLSNKKLRKFLLICYTTKITPIVFDETQNVDLQRKLYFDELRKQWT